MAYDPDVSHRPRILVVEDDFNVVQGLLGGLRRAGFDVEVVMDGTEACSRAIDPSFELVVLDLMLPGASGFEVLEAMSGRVTTPVLVLSARTELDARLKSFALGAVDYVSKPFFLEELVARIRVRLAMESERPRRQLAVGDCVMDLDARTVVRDGQDLGFTTIEFNVLAWLVQHTGDAIRRRQLAVKALGMEAASDRTVDSHVSRVRRKLGEDGELVKTVWGIGYRYEPRP